MQNLRLATTLISVVLLAACGQNSAPMTIAVGSEGTSYHAVGKILATHWQNRLERPIKILSGKDWTGISNCQAVIETRADFAIAQNDAPNNALIKAGQLRVVMPLYPAVFFIIYKSSLHPTSLKDLIKGRKVSIGPRTSGTALMTNTLLHHFGIDTTCFTPVYNSYSQKSLSDTVPVLFWLTGFNNPSVQHILADGNSSLYSLDSAGLAGHGSSVDGFCLNYRYAQPYLIPKGTFGSIPPQPVLTFSSDVVLLTRDDVDKITVYELAQSIFEHRQNLANKNSLLNKITDNFDASTLTFPLHEGVIMYLQRNQPSFLDKYANIIGVSVTLMVAIGGLISGLLQWNKRRKKDRLDKYLSEILVIEQQINTIHGSNQLQSAYNRIAQFKQEAFAQLIDDKLAADESFSIFLNLANNTMNLIQQRFREAG